MPNTNIATNYDTILHGDLTQQSVAAIAKRINMEKAEDRPDFEMYFKDAAWDPKNAANSFRTLIHQAIGKGEVANFTLREIIAPKARGLEYANFSETTKSYGTKFRYTWQDIEQNADSILADIASEGRQWVREMKTYIYGAALLATKSSLTFPNSGTNRLITMFRKARIVFTKLGIQNFSEGYYHAVMPVELSDLLTDEYRAVFSGNIPERKKSEATEGYVGSFSKFDVINPTKDGEKVLIDVAANGTINGYWVVFIGKNELGNLPLTRYHRKDGSSVETIRNPLGSGVLEDENGKLTADDNKQIGSVGINLKYFSAHVYDDRAIMTMYVPASYVTNFSEATDMADVLKSAAEVVARKDSVALPSTENPDFSGSNVKPLEKIKIYADKTTLDISDGDVAHLIAICDPASYENKVAWSSSSTSYATVSADGVVTPVGAGSVTITATVLAADAKTASNVTATISITVQA